MKLRTLALGAGLFLLTACGGGEPAHVENLAAGAAPSAAPIQWNDIRSEYIDALDDTDCPSGTGAQAGACNQARHDDIGALRIDADRLPTGQAKTDLIASLDNWNEKFAKYEGKNCTGTLNTGQLECVLDESILNMTIMNIVAVANGTTN